MRIGPVGFVSRSVDEAIALSKIVTEVTHDHPEGIKGAEAVAVAIVLSRQGASKNKIRRHVRDRYYPLDHPVDDLRETMTFDETCQGTVPAALMCFLESVAFEDAIRTAVSLGGDSDTITAITGSLAEAFHGIPADFITRAKTYLDARLSKIVMSWEHMTARCWKCEE
jgi:ADP-ribosyl-[dinitrogen reductase] hydrolase